MYGVAVDNKLGLPLSLLGMCVLHPLALEKFHANFVPMAKIFEFLLIDGPSN